jgi:hypothetical protein
VTHGAPGAALRGPGAALCWEVGAAPGAALCQEAGTAPEATLCQEAGAAPRQSIVGCFW